MQLQTLIANISVTGRDIQATECHVIENDSSRVWWKKSGEFWSTDYRPWAL